MSTLLFASGGNSVTIAVGFHSKLVTLDSQQNFVLNRHTGRDARRSSAHGLMLARHYS